MTEIVLIINFYNSEKTILKSLKTIINQKTKPYKVFLFDNSSNDNSEAIVKKIIKNYNYFHYIKIQNHMTLVNARNFSLKYVKKNIKLKNFYFSFCDSDDLWSSEWLSTIRKFTSYSYDLIISNGYYQSLNNTINVTSGYDHFYKDPFYCPIYLNTVLFHSNLIKNNKDFFDINFELIYDIDYWISNFNKLSYISLSDNLSTYVKHGSNLSIKNNKKILVERFNILKKHKLSKLKFFYKFLMKKLR
jgi:glycosyltransferase involved in cell wall biosynthesis